MSGSVQAPARDAGAAVQTVAGISGVPSYTAQAFAPRR